MTHEIKLSTSFCDAVLCGDKNFEIRLNDRGYQKGDYIKFIPYDGFCTVYHQIEEKTYRITYVMSGYGLEKEYVVFGIKEIQSQMNRKNDQ